MARSITPEQQAELVALQGRCTLMLDAFARAEPDAGGFAAFRATVDRVAASRSLSRMRAMLRELRGMQAALPPDTHRELARDLAARFGPDEAAERDADLVARVRARGRIRSEREYRVVCAYADAIVGDTHTQDEFRALGALLNGYMAAP
jgi:hypothetical protein